MAEQVIGLRIQLNGMNTVVQDIQTFEKLLKEAREDLNQIPIGSENFRELSLEIKNAEKKLGELKNSLEQGKKNVAEFGDSTRVVTQAFAGAAAAITLFGNENKAVTEAQRIVTQSLTVALTAQAIAQAEVGGATIATTIALKAEAAAAATTNGALKLLFTTVAANPFGAILVVLGAVAAAFSFLGDEAEETGETVKQTSEYFRDAKNETVAAGEKLKVYARIVNDTNQTEKVRQEAYKELKKILPELENLTLKQALATGVLNKAVEREIQLIKLRAQLKALEAIYIEEKKKENEEEKKRQDSIRLTIELEAQLRAGKAEMGGATKAEAQAIGDAYRQQQLAAQGWLSTEDKIVDLTSQILALEGDRTVVIQQNTNATKQDNKVLEQRLRLQNEQLKLLSRLNEAEGEYTSEALQRLKELRTELEKQRDTNQEFYKSAEEDFQDFLSSVIPTNEDLKALLPGGDPTFSIFQYLLSGGKGYKALFTDDKNQIELNAEGLKVLIAKQYKSNVAFLETLVKDKTVTDLEKRYSLANLLLPDSKEVQDFTFNAIVMINQFKNLIDENGKYTGEILDEQIKSVNNYFQRIVLTADKYSGKINLGGVIVEGLDKERSLEIIDDFLSGVFQILNDPTILPGFKEPMVQQLVEGIFQFDKKTLDDFTGTVEEKQLQLEAYNEAVTIVTENFKQFGITQIETFNEVTKGANEYTKEWGEIVKILSDIKTPTKDVGDVLNAQVEFGNEVADKIRSNIDLLDVFFQDLADKPEEYFRKLRITSNNIFNIIDIIQGKFGELNKLTYDELLQLQTELLTAQKAIIGTFGEEAGAQFEDFIAAVGKALKQVQKETNTALDEQIQKWTFGLQQLSATLSNLAQTFSEAFSLQLEENEYNYNKSLDSIVGDTKEANAKRIELEKGYQAEKKKLEKQARLASLRIQLAETVAAGAQGVVQAINAAKGNPVLAAVFGSINAGIAAFQLQIIAQQIAFVQQMRRGGRATFGLGGSIMGPSHENGGIKYAGGGIELEGNEAIINRNSTIKYGSLLSTINQAEGGRPIMVGSAMDSRLIEVLAKQKQEPIKAYVLESEITKSQNINRKLEQLASF